MAIDPMSDLAYDGYGYTPTPAGTPVTREAIAALYRQYFNREPDEAGLQAHLKARDMAQVEQSFRNSSEWRNRPVPYTASGAPTSGATSTTPANTGTWNTDGYATPGYTASRAGGAMAGWDAGKWADAAHQTPKYVTGRILSQYAPSIDTLGQAIAEIQKAYPGATWNGKDTITIPGVGSFDVLTNSGSGQNMAWSWQDLAAPSAVTSSAARTSTGAQTVITDPSVTASASIPSDPVAARQYYIANQIGPNTDADFWSWMASVFNPRMSDLVR